MILDDGGDLTNMVLDRYPNLTSTIRGISEETTRRLQTHERVNKNTLSIPAININDSVAKSNLVINMDVKRVLLIQSGEQLIL